MEVNSSVRGKGQIHGYASQGELLFLDRERSFPFIIIIIEWYHMMLSGYSVPIKSQKRENPIDKL
jgi:hypothetical protein